MNRNQIKRVGNACVKLAEHALMLKTGLPIFVGGTEANSDWPVIAGEVRQLRADLERIEQLLVVTLPVRGEDLQWHLCKYDLPDAGITVLVSIIGRDDAHEAYLDYSEEGLCWLFSNDTEIDGKVYAWAEMPPSLHLRENERLGLPAPAEERRAS